MKKHSLRTKLIQLTSKEMMLPLHYCLKFIDCFALSGNTDKNNKFIQIGDDSVCIASKLCRIHSLFTE